MGNAELISSIVADYTPDPEKQRSLVDGLKLDKKVIVGVVGALVPHKDPLTMVHAAAAVHHQLPNTVFLHFGEGALRPAVEAAIAENGLRDKYLLLGHRNGVENFFPLFSCFAMSSREEGLGSSVLDAFKYGVPVAATSAGGLAELVGGRGLLCAAGDATALGANIIRLLTDAPYAATLVDTARSYVTTDHDRTVLTSRYLSLYKKLISP
jgi:glycosyltransferase involved in cell wall biosynthesis